MVALAVLFLQVVLGIGNPSPAQINSVSATQAQSMQPVAGQQAPVTASYPNPYIDPNEIF